MLTAYLNQTAEVLTAERNEDGSVKMNNRGEIQYADLASVPCRKRQKTQEIILPDKQQVKTTLIYYFSAEYAIREDDIVDGLRVQRVADWVNLSGEIVGYKAEV